MQSFMISPMRRQKVAIAFGRVLREARRVPARLVGVRLSGLLKSWKADQLSLFTTPGASGETARDRRLSNAINGVREKFGPKSILPGALSDLATLRPERHM